ncbi:hypothetical protein EVJ58_g1873 [Rhodofomes roseus]|uniref:HAT C-terminal dimerisation domain-containing protein n=1 Tax=Rhodofomes roseus TaxID=34475 RepID=A0A4Y9YZH8_9APHY|nr:hypothetical protein EVJ58_g1873 [Rhodofomes roseus]
MVQSQKRTNSSPEATPQGGKRMRIPTEKVLAADAEKRPSKPKKTAAHGSTQTASQSRPASQDPAPVPTNQQAAQKTTSSVPVPDRRVRVEDIPEDEDSSSNDEVVEVDANGRRKKDRAPKEESPEEELARVSKEWSAPVYAFYKPEVTIKIDDDGKRAHLFHCANRGCKIIIKRWLDKQDRNSTSNLRKHTKKCFGEEALASADAIGSAAKARDGVKAYMRSGDLTVAFARTGKGPVTYSVRQHTKNETRAEIVRWVAESLRPFSIVEDRAFQALMKTGRPEYYLPSRWTVARDVQNVFKNTRTRIASMLQEYQGELNFATDCWTSPNHKAMVAFSVHFEIDGAPCRMVLDVIELARSHSGVNLAAAFADLVKDLGIDTKMLAVTADNATANDVMIDELDELIDDFRGQRARVRCFDHILNLVVKTLLKQFDTTRRRRNGNDDGLDAAEAALQELTEGMADIEDDDDVDEWDLDAVDLEDDDVDGWVDEQQNMTAEEVAELDATTRPVKLVLAKSLRKFAFSVIHSPTKLLPAWSSKLEQNDLPQENMPRDVRTRWNSTYMMLQFALEYRDAINALTGDRAMDLRRMELDDGEWKIVSQLCDVLKIFWDATQFFSRATPNLAMVIPVMDHLDEHLTNYSLKASVLPSIRAAVGLAKKTLNRYYGKTDESDTYRIAMVLHPRYKLRYFENARWQEGWINTAEELVRDEYADWRSRHAAMMKEIKKSKNIFDNLPALAPPKPAKVADELVAYLASDVEAVQDPVRWWYEHRRTYPNLSWMAISYLTIPATSADVERIFSRGRLVLPHIRNGMSAQSIRAVLCLGDWSKLGFVKDTDILKVTSESDNGAKMFVRGVTDN